MAKIEIDGVKYPVLENLGFQGGYYAKLVYTETGHRVVIKKGGKWAWHTVQDRLQQVRNILHKDR